MGELKTRTVILVTIVAIIALTTFTMFANAAPANTHLITGVDAGQGSVSPNCPYPGCLEAGGSTVTVTATPSLGWVFASWSTQTGVVCTSNPCSFTVPALSGASVLKATFDPAPIPAQATHPINVGGEMLPLNLIQVLAPWIAAMLALTVVAIETLVVRRKNRKP